MSLEHVRTRNGGFAAEELETAVDTPERNALIADACKKYCGGRKAVIFTCSVAHALSVRDVFRDRGIPCEAVWGAQPEPDRRAVIEGFRKGAFSVLSNCMLLTEGFDAPEIEAVLMARPTKSCGLYIQSVGRGLRPAPGKKECLLLDFVDVSGRHSLCGAAALTGRQPRNGETVIEAEEREQAERTARSPLLETTREADLFRRSDFVWVMNGRNYRLVTNNGTVVCDPEGNGYRVYLMDEDAGVTLLTGEDERLPLSWAQSAAEDYARKNASLSSRALLDKEARWRKDPATDRQMEVLERLKIPYDPSAITKGEAAELTANACSQPATNKQVWYIGKNKLHLFPWLLTKRMAGRIIGEHKAK